MAVDGLPETVEELTITRSGDERLADRNQLEKKVVESSTSAAVPVAPKFSAGGSARSRGAATGGEPPAVSKAAFTAA